MIIFWLPEAEADRDDLVSRIGKDSPRAALEQDDRIQASIDHLLNHPDLGRSGRVSGTRELVVPRMPYIVLYRRVTSDRIDILRVLHGARRWPPQP